LATGKLQDLQTPGDGTSCLPCVFVLCSHHQTSNDVSVVPSQFCTLFPSTEMKMGLKQSVSPFSPPEGASVQGPRQVRAGLGETLVWSDEACGEPCFLATKRGIALCWTFPFSAQAFFSPQFGGQGACLVGI
jgi:hypothetical protein